MARTEQWKKQPDAHDYPAAQDYLSLVFPESTAASLVRRLKTAPLVQRKAKDLLRSSQLPLLPETNFHVRADLKKVRKGQLLSPVLLIRGNAKVGLPLTIADGYHRVCTSYHIDEDANIPCRIADLPGR